MQGLTPLTSVVNTTRFAPRHWELEVPQMQPEAAGAPGRGDSELEVPPPELYSVPGTATALGSGTEMAGVNAGGAVGGTSTDMMLSCEAICDDVVESLEPILRALAPAACGGLRDLVHSEVVTRKWEVTKGSLAERESSFFFELEPLVYKSMKSCDISQLVLVRSHSGPCG